MVVATRPRALLHLLLIGAAGLAVYANALGGEFLYDDEFLIQRNRFITDCAYLKDIFTTDVTAGAYRLSNFYHPVHTSAVAYSDQGRLDLAERHYQQAIALEDVYAETRYNLGRFYLQQGRLDDALAQFARALELEPDFIYAHQTLQEIMSKPSAPKTP